MHITRSSITQAQVHSATSDEARAEGGQTPLQRNARIENALIDHIATHPAAKAAFRALAGSLTDTFVKAHGEIKGWAEIIQAASCPVDSNSSGSGTLSPRFDTLGSVGWNGAAIRATCHSGSFREQGTLCSSLLVSDGFKRIVEQASTDTALQEKLSGTMDFDYLKAVQGDLYKESGWVSQTREIREAAGKPQHYPAASLSRRQVGDRELAFHRHAPINHPSNQPRVGFDIPPPADADLQVLRDHGGDVWRVRPESNFAKRADEAGKPVVAGPSGSTHRLMSAARLLGPGCREALGIDDEGALKELIRYAAYGYLVQDRHHSMLEVNLGAAAHGLAEQWDDSLYTQPFSQAIQGRGFTLDNQAHQHLVRQFEN